MLLAQEIIPRPSRCREGDLNVAVVPRKRQSNAESSGTPSSSHTSTRKRIKSEETADQPSDRLLLEKEV